MNKLWNISCCPQESEINELKKSLSAAKIRNGPCERSVEPVLQRHGIQRQSYHGGAFVGNHVRKALTQPVIHELTSAPKVVVAERCPALASIADDIADRHSSLMSQYASCSELFNRSSAVTDEDLEVMEGRITTFMATARREVIARGLGNVTPKLHLVEDYVVACMRKFRVGLGLLGKKGGEGIHHELNILSSTFSSIRDDLQRLKTTVHHHCVATLPQQLPHIPVPTPRPGRRKD